MVAAKNYLLWCPRLEEERENKPLDCQWVSFDLCQVLKWHKSKEANLVSEQMASSTNCSCPVPPSPTSIASQPFPPPTALFHPAPGRVLAGTPT